MAAIAAHVGRGRYRNGGRTGLILSSLFLFSAAGLIGEEHSVNDEFWAEGDLYVTLNERARLMFMVARYGTRETETRERSVGMYIDLFVPRFQPLLFRRISHLDDARVRRIALRAGYRYVRGLDDPASTEHRLQTDATLRWALVGHILMSERNRGEYRLKEGAFSFRYRNEVKFEHDFAVHRGVLTPYVTAEGFYDTRYSRISRWNYTAGVVWSLGKHLAIEPYWRHQVTKHPALRITNGFGLTVSYYLP